MRTKALLVAAGVIAAGIATSLAQGSNVYSLNVVGYVNIPLASATNNNGFTIAGNPLDLSNIAGNNSINNVLPPQNGPLGLKVYTYNGAYSIVTLLTNTFSANSNHWSDFGATVLNPGSGFWLKSPSNQVLTMTFVGEVMQSGAGSFTNPVPAGFALKASQIPQKGQLDTDLGYPALAGSTRIYLFGTNGYSISSFLPPTFAQPSNHWNIAPVADVGQGFWTKETAATNWVRQFNVQ